MKRAALSLAVLLAALVGGPAALSEEQPVDAVWEKRPTSEDLASIWPTDGLCRGQVAGETVVECRLTDGGLLEQCKVVKEEPVGCGFGELALKTTRFFKARTALPDGRPIRPGMRIVLPMSFAPTDQGPVTPARWSRRASR